MGSGTKTQGVAVINQARFVDYTARKAQFIESTSPEVIDDAMNRLQAAINAEIN
jgi:mRNA interferase ChpB